MTVAVPDEKPCFSHSKTAEVQTRLYCNIEICLLSVIYLQERISVDNIILNFL